MRVAREKSSDAVFRSTLQQLEDEFTVAMIATLSAQSFDVETPLVEVSAVMLEKDYSQILAQKAGAVVGIVEDRAIPQDVTGLHVGDVMKPMSSDLIVPANLSLRRLITILARSSPRYRLVSQRTGEVGIVTRTDLLDLPVRLLLFSYIAHLESLFEAVILKYSEDDTWIELLAREPDDVSDEAREALGRRSVGSKGRDKLLSDWHKRSERGDTPYLIQLTQFPQKWYVVHQLRRPGARFLDDMADIQWYFRNIVVHAGDYVPTEESVVRLERRLTSCEQWIAHFAKDMHGQISTDGT
jgi:predicted transcriptional regulator